MIHDSVFICSNILLLIFYIFLRIRTFILIQNYTWGEQKVLQTQREVEVETHGEVEVEMQGEVNRWTMGKAEPQNRSFQLLNML